MATKKICVLFTILLSMVGAKAYSTETTFNGIRYYVDLYQNECWVIKDTKNNGFVTSSNYSGMIVLPSEIEYEGVKYPVKKIDSYAFYESKVTFLSIPNTIKEIGTDAFSLSSNLERVVLPDKLEILPKYCFFGCSNLKSIVIPDFVSKIDEGAFQNSGLESIALPQNVQYIGDYAFANSKSLQQINMPDALNYLGKAVFRDCPKLNLIEVPESHPLLAKYNNMLISKDTTKIFFCPQSVKGVIQLHKKTKVIENSAFYGCSSITKIVFNEKLDSILDSSFYGCSRLKELLFPKGLIYIGERAFDSCTSVTNILLPNTLKELGFGCFYYTAISNITIPGSIDLLENKFFCFCDNLYTVNLRCAVPPKRFEYLFPLGRQMNIHVLKGLKQAYESAEYWKEYATFYDDLEWVMVSDIQISSNEYYCNVNEVMKATAVVLPDNADARNPIWSSDDESIVYIDKDGKFIGLREGTTNIIATATDGSGVFATATVHVQNSLIGDLNGDGNIDSADIEEIENYIMGNPSVYFDVKKADVNEDGNVNVADIVYLTNQIHPKQ